MSMPCLKAEHIQNVEQPSEKINTDRGDRQIMHERNAKKVTGGRRSD
jgi:hypothetical protein